MAEEWISLREFARRRGVSLMAVQKAIESARVTAVRRDGDRLVGIEVHQATAQWNANTDPAAAAKTGKTLDLTPDQSAVSPDAEKGADTEQPAPDKDPHGYYQARADRERHQAKLVELELAREMGLVIPAEEQRQVSARRYKAIRDGFLNMPDRIAAVLAAERDPARVHAALTNEIKRVLHELSDDARTEVTRGAAERVAA
jgi:hypothetical protein